MLIRSLDNVLVGITGKGDRFRVIVTKKMNNKLVTDLYGGDCLLTCNKSISKRIVGNKTVRTKEKVVQRDNDSFEKLTTDRVYEGSNLVGIRVLYEVGDSLDKLKRRFVAKQGIDDVRLTKIFNEENNSILFKTYKKGLHTGSFYDGPEDGLISYNDKNLPISSQFDISEVKGLSLAEMVKLNQLKFPGKKYVADEFKLQKLNLPLEK